MKEYVAAKLKFRAELFRRNPKHPDLGLIDADIARSQRVIDLLERPTFTLPKGAIRLPDIQTIGMSNPELKALADSTRGLNIDDSSMTIDIIRKSISSAELHIFSLVALDVRTMGFRPNYCPTTKQIWEKAIQLGDSISAEAMIKLATEAAKGNFPVERGKPLVGVMDPITGWDDDPHILSLVRLSDGLWLNSPAAVPDSTWHPAYQFVVSARK